MTGSCKIISVYRLREGERRLFTRLLFSFIKVTWNQELKVELVEIFDQKVFLLKKGIFLKMNAFAGKQILMTSVFS